MSAVLLVVQLLCAADVEEREAPALGAHAGVSLGLFAVDLNAGMLYGFAATPLGITMMADGKVGLGIIGIGATFPMGPKEDTHWVFDLFGEASGGIVPGFSNSGSTTFGAFGVGLGFRYLHPSGFVLGFKLPLFGVALGLRGHVQPGDAVGLFYWANVLALPLMSLGYRF